MEINFLSKPLQTRKSYRQTFSLFSLFTSLTVLGLPFLLWEKPLIAQTVDLPKIPTQTTPIPPRQPSLPAPQLPPNSQPIQIPIPSSSPGKTSPEAPQQICVKGFDITGSSIFKPEEFDAAIRKALNIENWEKCVNLRFEQLLLARNAVTELYRQAQYLTTGAYIPEQELSVDGGTVIINIVEGEIEDIKISGNQNLNPNYIRSRLELVIGKPLNQESLIQGLQLLRLNPLIANINAELSASKQPGKNILQVNITEANPFKLGVTFDNNRSPSAGSFRRLGTIGYNNLLGIGDSLTGSYINTDGSNEFNVGYTVPFNPRNGTLSFAYRNSNNEVIEKPFNDLDIQANYRSYELTVRQPIIQTAKPDLIQELALGITAQRQESNTSILGVDYPLSAGADEQGRTRISALRFFQEWTQRRPQEVFAARSEFSLGVGWRATVNEQPPDSRFLAWRGQVQWLQLLGDDRSDSFYAPAILLRSDAQLATRSLVPLEQFGLGGQTSIRGYRQDALLTDNGILGSAEFWLPIIRFPNQKSVLQIIPFIDVGTGWNSSGREAPNTNTLAGVGVGLQFLQSQRLRARFDWGIPLVNIDSGDKTWQEKGLYFSVEYNPF